MRKLSLFAVPFASATLILFSPPWVRALNEPTHEIINEQATRNSTLDTVLRNRLNIEQGILRRFPGIVENAREERTVVEWIRRGGRLEDLGSHVEFVTGRARSLRHFHDPLQPWDQAGLIIREDQTGLGFRIPRGPYQSSIRWMHRTDQATEAVAGNFSLVNARDYFKSALTHPDKTTRDRAYANLFRALGQVMHLVVDASVPEHVRNDMHPMGTLVAQGSFGRARPYNYEYWVEAQHSPARAEAGFISTYLASRPDRTFDPVILRTAPTDPVATSPMARLIDTDGYTGANPAVTAGTEIGIGEVANANFFSEDRTGSEYPNPARPGLLTRAQPDPRGRLRSYRWKEPPGLQVRPVGVQCTRTVTWWPVPIRYDSLCTDAGVWAETGRHMLPRAVSYAQGVLDYFFRGAFRVAQLVPATDGARADLTIWQPDDAGPDIDRASMWLLNASTWGGQPERVIPNPETGLAGTLTLIARYREGSGDGAPEQSVTFVLRDPTSFRSLPHVADTATPVPLQFVLAPGQNPISTQRARKLEWTLVLEGQLGAEKNAVIARVLPGVVLSEVTARWARLGEVVAGRGDGITPETKMEFYHAFGFPLYETLERPPRSPDTIQVLVPPAIGVDKPGAGGAILLRQLSPQERVTSNPAPFTPLAAGQLLNLTGGPLRVTVVALGPVVPGAPEPLPGPWSVDLAAGESADFILPTGFKYTTVPLAVGIPAGGRPITTLFPNPPDFVFTFR